MARLKVLTVPNPKLFQKALPVEKVDDSIRKLMDDMLETMYEEEGCGLAATQVGINKRIVVIDVQESCPGTPILKLVNPEIIWTSSEHKTLSEGCLSVPGQRADITRPKAIKMRYLDENNKVQEIETDTFLATCIQHEIDHLDGKLFIDYLSPLKKQLLINKAKKFA